MKVAQTYTVKEFSLNPSRAIHRALQGVDVTISLRGVPAVRLVPALSAQSAAAMVDEFLFATYDLKLAKAAQETGVFTTVLS